MESGVCRRAARERPNTPAERRGCCGAVSTGCVGPASSEGRAFASRDLVAVAGLQDARQRPAGVTSRRLHGQYARRRRAVGAHRALLAGACSEVPRRAPTGTIHALNEFKCRQARRAGPGLSSCGPANPANPAGGQPRSDPLRVAAGVSGARGGCTARAQRSRLALALALVTLLSLLLLAEQPPEWAVVVLVHPSLVSVRRLCEAPVSERRAPRAKLHTHCASHPARVPSGRSARRCRTWGCRTALAE